MGSCDFEYICPRCGSVAVGNCWYHSDSYDNFCSFCGLHIHKMIYYEDCVDRYGADADADGYVRCSSGGYGVIKTNRHCYQKDIKGITKEIPSDEIIMYETWCDDKKALRIKMTKEGFEKSNFECIFVKKGNDWFMKPKFSCFSCEQPEDVIKNYNMKPDFINEAKRLEHIIYDNEDESVFLDTVESELHEKNNPNPHHLSEAEINGRKLAEQSALDKLMTPEFKKQMEEMHKKFREMERERKKAFLESYEKRKGKPFVFEEYIQQTPINLVFNALDKSLATSDGTKIDMDISDIEEYYTLSEFSNQQSDDCIYFGSDEAASDYYMSFVRYNMNQDITCCLKHLCGDEQVERWTLSLEDKA